MGINNHEEIYIIIYCFILLILNIDYIRDYNNIKEGLKDLSSDVELLVNPHGISWMFFVLIFNFFRRWLIYLLALFITGNVVVLIISCVLVVADLYDRLFNNTLAKLKKSKIRLFLTVVDTVYILFFVIYLIL